MCGAIVGTSPASIVVFPAAANGNVAPTRTITTPVAYTNFYGLATDAAGNLYATLQTVASTYSTVIEEFGPMATGAATPIKTIGGANTQLALAEGMRSDAACNLYVVNVTGTGSTRAYAIEQFAASVTGNTVPTAVIASTSFTNGGAQLALR